MRLISVCATATRAANTAVNAPIQVTHCRAVEISVPAVLDSSPAGEGCDDASTTWAAEGSWALPARGISAAALTAALRPGDGGAGAGSEAAARTAAGGGAVSAVAWAAPAGVMATSG